MIEVDVLVPTYQRPALLAQTLQSLARQRLPGGVRLRVVVVDNDAGGSARAVVEQVGSQVAGGANTYICEPVANVSNARNRALRAARGQLAAFIDDDEIAHSDWLQTLMQTRERHRAAIVFGPVIPQLPEGTRSWIAQGRFFERPRLTTGAVPVTGATGNVLLDVQAVRASGVEFDPALGRTGGEDADFFHRLRQAGLSAVWCDEALVYEHVPPERACARWLLRRAFIGGRNYVRIFEHGSPAMLAAGSLLLRSAAFFACSLLVPVAALGGVARAVHVGRKSANHLGRVVGLCQSWGRR